LALWPVAGVAAAWVALVVWGGDSQGLLTGGAPLMQGAMAGMPGMAGMGSATMLGVHIGAGNPTFSWPVFGAFLWMWAVMIVAMMVTVALPSFYRSRAVPTTAFVAASLLPWLAVAVPVYGLLAGLQVAFPDQGETALRVAAVVVVAGGAYELSRIKRRSRDRCCALCGGTWREGLRAGVAAVGCCGPMMGVLALLGLMNLVWMAVLTVVMVAERSLRWGPWLARTLAGALAVGAVIVLVTPRHFPAFA